MAQGMSEESGPQPARNFCPRCGVRVHKAHRRLRDRLVSVGHDVRRYRCKDCGWQGLLPQPRTVPRSRTRLAHSRTVWMLVGVLLIPLVGLSAAVYWSGAPAEQVPVPPGQSMAGTPLEPDDLRRADAKRSGELRRACVWGGPGQSPYLGTLTAALAAARLPSEIIGKFQSMQEGRLVNDRLEISRAGIHTADGRRYFGHTALAMALGETLCFSTRINMPPDTVGAADLYELIDDEGQRFTIMVVARGGNVAVLEEQSQR